MASFSERQGVLQSECLGDGSLPRIVSDCHSPLGIRNASPSLYSQVIRVSFEFQPQETGASEVYKGSLLGDTGVTEWARQRR